MAVALKKDKTEQYFNEYLDKLNNKEIIENSHCFTAYLNVFSRCGDINGMKKAINIIKTRFGN